MLHDFCRDVPVSSIDTVLPVLSVVSVLFVLTISLLLIDAYNVQECAYAGSLLDSTVASIEPTGSAGCGCTVM